MFVLSLVIFFCRAICPHSLLLVHLLSRPMFPASFFAFTSFSQHSFFNFFLCIYFSFDDVHLYAWIYIRLMCVQCARGFFSLLRFAHSQLTTLLLHCHFHHFYLIFFHLYIQCIIYEQKLYILFSFKFLFRYHWNGRWLGVVRKLVHAAHEREKS